MGEFISLSQFYIHIMTDKQLRAQLRKDLQDFMADRVADIREAAMETDPADWQGVIIHDLRDNNHDRKHIG